MLIWCPGIAGTKSSGSILRAVLPATLLVLLDFGPCLPPSRSWAPRGVLLDLRVLYGQDTLPLQVEAPFWEFWVFSWCAVGLMPPLQPENWRTPRLSASLLQGCFRLKPTTLALVGAFCPAAWRRLLPLDKGCAGFDLSLFGKLELVVWLRLVGEVEVGVLGRVCRVTALSLQCALRQGCDILFRNAN